jgi:hypothetical protein
MTVRTNQDTFGVMTAIANPEPDIKAEVLVITTNHSVNSRTRVEQ